MTTAEAVERITKHVIRTGVPAAMAVKALWHEISPIEDADNLIQYALANLVAVNYKKPSEPLIQPTKVSVRHQSNERREYSVSVSILEDLRYNVNGKVKAVISMNAHDLLTLSRQAEAMEKGWARYREVFTYGSERLTKLKKASVKDLADGERAKLARMFGEARNRLNHTNYSLGEKSQ